MYVICICLGIALFVAAYTISYERKDQGSLFESEHLYVMLAGEDFENMCNPHIDVEFDDDGNIKIQIKKDDEEENEIEDVLWVEMFNLDGFKWNTTGSVENVLFDESKVSGYLMTGLDKSDEWKIMSFFRVEVKGKSTISVKLKKPTYCTRYLASVNTPVICALTANTANNEEIVNGVVDLINSGTMTEEDKVGYAKGIMNSMFSVGKVGDSYLSPAMPIIDAIYNNTNLQFKNYDLRAKPSGFRNENYGLCWQDKFLQLYPIVEYRDNRAIEMSGIVSWVLYLISSFLVTMSMTDLIIKLGSRLICKYQSGR